MTVPVVSICTPISWNSTCSHPVSSRVKSSPVASVTPRSRMVMPGSAGLLGAVVGAADECAQHCCGLLGARRLPNAIVSGSPISTVAHPLGHRVDGRQVVRSALRGYSGTHVEGVPCRRDGGVMSYAVDFATVSTVGLESSPVAAALAGLRANEARYFKNKYDHVFSVEPAGEARSTIDWVHRILKEERDIVISSRPLEASAFEVDNIRMAYVFYESGLSINVMYTIDNDNKRAVGFKLSDGMEIPDELASRFKFARQKSKLAGTIRGSFFVIKGAY
jgi:hypothetical protein